MKADSVRPASLVRKSGRRYIFYIVIYNRHPGQCGVSASGTALLRGTASYLGVYLGVCEWFRYSIQYLTQYLTVRPPGQNVLSTQYH